MNVIFILTLILAFLMIIIGGKKGARSFLSLFLNFIVIVLSILFMTDESANPIIITLIACIIISSINLFLINKVNSKTVTAFVATVITISLLLIFIHFVTTKAMIQGFGEEEIEELSVFSLFIGVDLMKVATSVIIMSTIGAITDMAISITSPMWEIFHHKPKISRKELFTSGLTIGRDILGSNANTLFFAFFGGYMALLLWFKDLSYTIGDIANSKIFGAEMLIISFAGIGIALIIPIASFINAYYLISKQNK